MIRYFQLRRAVNVLKQCQHTSSSSPLAVSVNNTVSSGVNEKLNANKGLETSARNETNKSLESEHKPTRSTLVASVFASLKSAAKEGKDISDTFSEQIESAKSVADLLSVVESTKVSRKHALKIVTVLADWTCAGHIQASDFEADPRFLTLCRILGRSKSGKIETAPPEVTKVSSNDLATVLGITGDDEAAKLIGKISLPQMVKVMSSLAAKKRRSLPLLRSLAFNISSSSDKVDIKQSADILYASAILNFHDEVLLEKICSDLYECIPQNKKRAVIHSIVTSIGILKYRDTELLDTLSEWYVQNLQVCQTQDIVSILMTLATVYYTPVNADVLFTKLNSHVGSADMVSPSQWLDSVWSLVILGRATPEHYASVLSEKFINQLTSFDIEDMSVATKLKLLNINGAARLRAKDTYKGPLLDTNADNWKVQLSRPKEKQTLVTSVLEAMSNLLPSSQYIRTNINTGMGFLIDAEFMVDNKLTPMQLLSKSGVPITRSDSRRGIKVAILVLDYHDTTRRSSSMTGIAAFTVELTRLSEYKVLAINHSDFMSHSKLVARVRFLEQQLKLLIQNKI